MAESSRKKIRNIPVDLRTHFIVIQSQFLSTTDVGDGYY